MVQHPRRTGLPSSIESGYYKLFCRSSLDLLYIVALALWQFLDYLVGVRR